MDEEVFPVLELCAALVALVHTDAGVLRLHVLVKVTASDEVGLANDALVPILQGTFPG